MLRTVSYLTSTTMHARKLLLLAGIALSVCDASAGDADISLSAPTPYTKLLLESAVADGAVCLDGTPAPLYVRPGSGADRSNIVIFFEGGGWCESDEDCLTRSRTAYGSSKFNITSFNGRDLLQPNCVVNPVFCNWSVAYGAYVDGASRAGDAVDPVAVNGSTIYYRGARILRATIAALLAPGGVGAGMPSLATAPRVLITGSSAGGLTTFLHADAIAEAVHAVNPTADVRAVPEVGLFIDGESIWAKRRIMTEVFARVAEFQNVTGGAPEQVNAACVSATPPGYRSKCFMAQYTLPYMVTPTFVVNSMHDEWQSQNVLAPNTVTLPAVTTYEAFAPCISRPTEGCNATQAVQWTQYAGQFLDALAAARAATPAGREHGGVITSCPIHTTLIGGLSHRITVAGKTLYEHIAAWMAGGPSEWTIDVAYPRDATCPKPTEAALLAAGVDYW